jgi:very-short-patch-repair endonuclease
VSQLESELEFQIKAVGLKPSREFRFAPPRRWRADFCFERERVLVECEGQSRYMSRHQTMSGYRKDCEKYNAAAELGFCVLRYTKDEIRSGEALKQIERVVITRVPF